MSIVSKTKDQYWQMWRGLCILSVVLLHCIGTDYNLESFNSVYYFIVISIINFPVAVFFVLSGYFVKAKSFSGNMIGLQLKKRTIKLMVPYFVWTVVFIGFNLVLRHELSFTWIIQCLFTGAAATPFYYIIVLFYYTLLTPILVKFMNRKGFTAFVFIVCSICLIVFYCLKLSGYDVWHIVRYTIVWLPFYYSGILIRNRQISFTKMKAVSVILVIVSLLVELAEAYIIRRYIPNSNDMVLSQIKFTSFINSACIALLMFSFYQTKSKYSILEKGLINLGDNSYGIFIFTVFLLLYSKSFIIK